MQEISLGGKKCRDSLTRGKKGFVSDSTVFLDHSRWIGIIWISLGEQEVNIAKNCQVAH